jgi:hypothetical protein
VFREARFCDFCIFEDVHPRGGFNPFVWFELLVLELMGIIGHLSGSVQCFPYEVVVQVSDTQCHLSELREDFGRDIYTVWNIDVTEPSGWIEVIGFDPI